MNNINLIKGDCLEEMDKLIEKGVKVDAIITDPPYGTTACKWDKVINFKEMWQRFEKILKPNGTIIMNAQQPFTSLLICSNLELYKYNLIWEKDNATNFLNSKYQPLKYTEDICIFSKGASSYSKNPNMTYNPILTEGKPYTTTNSVERRTNAVIRSTIHNIKTTNKGTRQPRNIIKIIRDKEKIHPTQKPVKLMEYLIKTYTNENDLVLDCFIGSGTTGVACKNLKRDFIGIEMDDKYYQIAKERINKNE